METVRINGYDVDLSSFKMSTCGEVGYAYKDGVKKFCKKFNDPVDAVDNGTLSPKLQERRKKEFQEFTARRIAINRKLREVAGMGGNIIRPESEFEYNAHWYEITEFVPNVVSEEEVPNVIENQSEDNKLKILKIAIQSLRTVHGVGIVHADLKIPNIMLVKTASNVYASKIIDFDGAFFENDVPLEGITGTLDYFSPELALYFQHEDPEEREGIVKMITTKSDIFTMGLVLHKYLTGEFPTANRLSPQLSAAAARGYIYPWQIVRDRNNDGSMNQLKVDSTRIRHKWLVALISDMLQLDYTRRPTTTEIISAMDRRAVIVDEKWPEDNIEIDADKIKSNYAGLRRVAFKGRDGNIVHCYSLIDNDGIRTLMDVNDLKNKNLAKEKAEILPPLPDDNIIWGSKLYEECIGIKPNKSRKGFYTLTYKNGNQRHVDIPLLKMLKYATPKDTPPPPPPIIPKNKTLWESDAEKYEIIEGAQMSGITFAGRCEEEPSQHLYYIDRGNNFLQRVPLSTLVMFKLVRRKS